MEDVKKIEPSQIISSKVELPQNVYKDVTFNLETFYDEDYNNGYNFTQCDTTRCLISPLNNYTVEKSDSEEVGILNTTNTYTARSLATLLGENSATYDSENDKTIYKSGSYTADFLDGTVNAYPYKTPLKRILEYEEPTGLLGEVGKRFNDFAKIKIVSTTTKDNPFMINGYVYNYDLFRIVFYYSQQLGKTAVQWNDSEVEKKVYYAGTESEIEYKIDNKDVKYGVGFSKNYGNWKVRSFYCGKDDEPQNDNITYANGYVYPTEIDYTSFNLTLDGETGKWAKIYGGKGYNMSTTTSIAGIDVPYGIFYIKEPTISEDCLTFSTEILFSVSRVCASATTLILYTTDPFYRVGNVSSVTVEGVYARCLTKQAVEYVPSSKLNIFEYPSNPLITGFLPNVTVADNSVSQTGNTANGNLYNANKTLYYLKNAFIEEYKNGKICATLTCLVEESENGKANLYKIGDIVEPYTVNAQGAVVSMFKDKWGNAKQFDIIAIKVYYNGAVWQDLTLLEHTVN